MTYRDYLRVLRRSWLILVSVILVAIALGSVYSLTAKRSYQATAQLFVAVRQADNVSDLSQGSTYLEQTVASYAQIANTPLILNAVMSQLAPAERSRLEKAVSTTASTDNALLAVSVTWTSPDQAANLANAVANSLAKTAPTLSTVGTSDQPALQLTVIRQALPPSAPASPNIPLALLVSGALGVILGTLLTVAREVIDTRTRTPEELARITEAPVLAAVPLDTSLPNDSLAMMTGRHQGVAEAYRTLRTNLLYLSATRAIDTVVVTSSVATEGKSTTAANLALSLANADRSVLLIDADMRRPTVHDVFGIDGSFGLADVIADPKLLDASIQRWSDTGLDLLPAGKHNPFPTELLQSAAFDELLSTLKARYSIILLDAPPILPVSDGALLAAKSDVAILVAAVGRVRREQLLRTRIALAQVDSPPVGVVATMVRSSDGYGNYGYDAYAYRSSSTEPSA